MSKNIWHDCKKQPPLVDDGELVLMDSNDKIWVGFCEITSDGVSYFANNAEPLKNDFVKYARIDKLLARETENKDLSDKIGKLETELERTRKALDVAVDALKRIRFRGEHSKYKCCKMSGIIAQGALDKITALEQKQPTFVHNKIKFPEYNDGLLEEFDKQFFENGQDDDLTETALEQKD